MAHSMNDLATLTQPERDLFEKDAAIEAAFQGWAEHMVAHGQTLNLRHRFIDDLRRLYAEGKLDR